MLEIANFVACFAAWREITRLKGVGTRFRVESGLILSATRYQFGQLNDPHLQGVKHVICSVISVAAASSSRCPLTLSLPCHGSTLPKSWGMASRHHIYWPCETLLHILAVGAVFSYRRYRQFSWVMFLWCS